MRIDQLPIGLYQENVWVLHDQGHVLVFDPGCYKAKEILKKIDDNETVDGIILTHGHEDHTLCTDDLADLCGCPVYIHPLDGELLKPDSPERPSYCAPVYSRLNSLREGEMTVGVFRLHVYHTPGHTMGSVCIRYKNLLISGDTLFAGSIGRTDLYGGDDYEMGRSLKKLKELPGSLTVCPGHGPSTTLAYEFKTNRYVLYYIGQYG